jgi:uncharacterized membrane protein YeaQ/YmgE (transglycosylase-associated protein family)
MIGDIDFGSFLVLLAISAVVSAVLHYGFKFYVVAGTGSFLSKVIIGWVGARAGSPILGHWWEGLNYQHIYFVPAILGAAAVLILAIDLVKTCSRVCGGSAGEA